MADGSAAPPEVGVRRLEPRGEAADAALIRAASLHLRCLPWTASSRAGLDVLEELYRAALLDEAGVVLTTSGGPAGEGGVASGSVDLRATERRVRQRMAARRTLWLRLAARAASAPLHLLARWAWERVIPREGIGYVLTLGVTEGSPVRGAELLGALERALVERGAREVWVDTERSNGRAVAFYARHGYEIASARFGQVLLRKQVRGEGAA